MFAQLLALTNEFEDVPEVNPQDLENAFENTAAANAAMAGLGVFMIIFIIIAIVLGIFTLWMLIDSIIRKDEEYPNGSGKVMWILLIVFLGFIPAIIYYFAVKKKVPRGQGGGNVPPAPTNNNKPPQA